MVRILLLETSAALCSAALSEDGRCVAYKECTTPRSHAAMTAVLIDELLKELGLRIQDCDAVCVSRGPGSYTGLRVGVSTAKGLCFGAGIPLLAVGTLDVLVAQAAKQSSTWAAEFDTIIPVVDARRDEVYTAVYTPDPDCPFIPYTHQNSPSGFVVHKRATPVRSLIVGQEDFAFDFPGKSVLFIGDAADKCARLLSDPAQPHALRAADFARCSFVQTQPQALAMAAPAQKAFESGAFEDVAYFEPFYLKDFVATTSKKKLF